MILEVPLVVIMFRTQQEYTAYSDMPEGVVAFYNGISNAVVMYEESRLVSAWPDLALKLAISTVAHEGVHQILANIGVQQRLSRAGPCGSVKGWPSISSPNGGRGQNIRWKGVGMVNDLRMKELEVGHQGGLEQGPPGRHHSSRRSAPSS